MGAQTSRRISADATSVFLSRLAALPTAATVEDQPLNKLFSTADLAL